MLNNEEGCIRYLMREMDPSEEIEFEREMMKDENLLIEVESLRKTYEKLGKLPLKSPPEDLTRSIVDDAVKTQKEHISKSRAWTWNMSRSVAAAAILLMIVSTGLYFDGKTSPEPADQPNISTTATIQTGTASVVQPWVDRNNSIYFAGTAQQVTDNNEFEQEINHSFNKLTLINSDTGFSTPSRKILLTSSKR